MTLLGLRKFLLCLGLFVRKRGEFAFCGISRRDRLRVEAKAVGDVVGQCDVVGERRRSAMRGVLEEGAKAFITRVARLQQRVEGRHVTATLEIEEACCHALVTLLHRVHSRRQRLYLHGASTKRFVVVSLHRGRWDSDLSGCEAKRLLRGSETSPCIGQHTLPRKRARRRCTQVPGPP